MKRNKKRVWANQPVLSAIWMLLVSTLTGLGCYEVDPLDTEGATADDKDVIKDTGTTVDTDSVVATEEETESETITEEADDVNYCLALDGDEDYVRIRHDKGLAVSGDWTMEAWVWYRNDGSMLHPVFRGADESTSISSYFMYCEYDDILNLPEIPMAGFGHSSSSFEALYDTERLPTEEWMHMAFVRDGQSHRFYLDGQIVAETTSDLDARPVADDVIIGAILHPRKTGYLNGYVDDIRLSNVVRYEEEFSPRVRLDWDDDTIVLWNFDVEYSDDYTMDVTGTFRSEFYGDAHIVEREWSME